MRGRSVELITRTRDLPHWPQSIDNSRKQNKKNIFNSHTITLNWLIIKSNFYFILFMMFFCFFLFLLVDIVWINWFSTYLCLYHVYQQLYSSFWNKGQYRNLVLITPWLYDKMDELKYFVINSLVYQSLSDQPKKGFIQHLFVQRLTQIWKYNFQAHQKSLSIVAVSPSTKFFWLWYISIFKKLNNIDDLWTPFAYSYQNK